MVVPIPDHDQEDLAIDQEATVLVTEMITEAMATAASFHLEHKDKTMNLINFNLMYISVILYICAHMWNIRQRLLNTI